MSKSNAKAAAERLKNQSLDKQNEVKNEEQALPEVSTVNENFSAIKAKDSQNDAPRDKDASVAVIDELSCVEFLAPYKRYSKGDVAAFSPSIAKDLIDKKVAVLPGESIETEVEPV
jgi:hypothetical protein